MLVVPERIVAPPVAPLDSSTSSPAPGTDAGLQLPAVLKSPEPVHVASGVKPTVRVVAVAPTASLRENAADRSSVTVAKLVPVLEPWVATVRTWPTTGALPPKTAFRVPPAVKAPEIANTSPPTPPTSAFRVPPDV